jgi:hypothetical protein
LSSTAVAPTSRRPVSISLCLSAICWSLLSSATCVCHWNDATIVNTRHLQVATDISPIGSY